MKTNTVLCFLFVLFLLSTVPVPTGFAQDAPQWDLPDGVRARLGKGAIREIAYSPGWQSSCGGE